MDYEFIFLVLLPASLFDLSRYRIPNEICIAGLFISLIRHLELQGLNGVWPWLAGMIIPLFLYYLLFRLRVFGAADGKFISVVGSYVGVPGVFFVLFFSLIMGAFLSVIKMIKYRSMTKRISHLFSYLKTVCSTGKIEPYIYEYDDREAVVPYGVAIGFGTLFAGLVQGGIG